MAFFADLTPHTYTATGGKEVLNIGWLDEGQPFPVGPTPRQFQKALLKLCQRPILLHRGTHPCWFCGGKHPECGNGQIRVLGKSGIWYAAPTLVHHYVVRHEYQPPAEFIDAVVSPAAVGTDDGWRT